MASLYDIVRVYTVSAGTGSPIALGAAVPTFRTPAQAGIPDGARLSYAIEDIFGGGRETGWGTYAASGQTLTRNTTSSSNVNNPISLSGQAQIYVTALAADMGWSNTRLAKTASYTVANQDKNATVALGGAAFFTLTFGTASGYDANFAVLVVNEDTGRGKTIALTGGATFILWPLQSIIVFNQNNTWQTLGRGPWILTANANFVVDPVNGLDSNDGLASGAGNAWKTLQGAYNSIIANLYTGGFTTSVFSASGTDTGGLLINSPWNGGGTLQFIGNTGAPDNCKITTSGHCVNINCALPGSLGVEGFQLSSTGNGYCVLHSGAGQVNVAFNDYGAVGDATSYHLYANASGASINVLANYQVTGGAIAHMATSSGGVIRCNGVTCTFNTSPTNFSTAFAYSSEEGIIQSTGMTWTNKANVTGSRYSANTNSIIDTFGSGAAYFPGNAAGAVDAFGGIYA
jgi:hypothetical protein